MVQRDFELRRAKYKLCTVQAKIYLQDPMVAATQPNVALKQLKLDGEASLGAGPTSSRVAVVDYNADLDEVFEAAHLKKNGTGFVVGRKAPEANLQFHQVNVWAVITNTLQMLEDERVFGRRIPWAFERGRLLVLPHAGYWENAFYDRSTGALHFFYFEDQKGNPVYTCLSHDIVTHELGHAVLDGLKPYYNEVSSPATAGFHEYFGDAIAMTSALSHREIAVEVVGRGSGDLSAANLIANIAAQFGRATSREQYGEMSDYYLRSGLNRRTMDDLEGVYEPHDYSEVMTGVYYDLLRAFYEHLLKHARYAGPKKRREPQVRVKALLSAAGVVSRLLLRALDYCQPVDIDYYDYARAVNRADFVAYPLDPMGFRQIAAEIFKKRKIVSAKAKLRRKYRIYNDKLRNLDVGVIGASKTDAYHFVDANRRALQIPATANLEIVNVYRTRKISADSYRPPRELIVEFVWPEEVGLQGVAFGDLSGSKATLWCGGTLVFDIHGNLLHYTLKKDAPERRQVLTDYVAHLVQRRSISVDDGERGLGARGKGGTLVIARIADGRLRMERSAALRHARIGG